MRIRTLALALAALAGGCARVIVADLAQPKLDIIGAYQGQFIFIDRAGVYFGRSLEGTRFFALARTGDGRLAVPGAIERPAESPAQ